MIGIQIVSARSGRVTGRGLADNMLRNFPKRWVWGITVLLVIANVINLGADLGAMGAAVNLLIGGPALLHACVLAVVFVRFAGVCAVQSLRAPAQIYDLESSYLRGNRLRSPCSLARGK